MSKPTALGVGKLCSIFALSHSLDVLPIAQVTRAEQVDLCFGGKPGAIELFYSNATTPVRDENL